ncbi:MAG TPA: serine/threonine-protein kinase [Polyangia bacterium]|nr:serine/threonine-protein kinase [Polyangia bacterium]
MANPSDTDRARLAGSDDDATTEKRPSPLVENDAPPPTRSAIKPGLVIGQRYKLIDRLGVGAMGEVFVAENLAIRQRVAVKLLKKELLADATFRERFEQEARAVAAIEHPNVARFLDLVDGDPTFLVMEYVRGQTLAERLKSSGKLPHPVAVEIAVRLCWALEAAHRAGIIHRDLKPSNVILAPDVERGETPKLIDFGLAKLASVASSQGLTRTGQVVGTPRYMSPEQIAGRPVDARCDVYALGCVLYEMLAGRPPFDGDDDVQVLYRQIHDPPAPLGPDVPEALAAVMTRALEKLPDDRYASMAELARALERSLGLKRSQALYHGDEEGTTNVMPETPPRRVSPVALVALAAVLSAGGFFGGRWLSRRQRALDLPPPSGGLLLMSDPTGAAVTLDGKPLGRKTPTWAAELAPGPHTVRFERPDSAPVTETVNLKPDERAVVQVSLPEPSHKLEVRSSPDGAQVFLDGRMALGATPTVVDVTDADFHELRLVKDGFQTAIKAITPDDKMPQLLITLQPETEPRGTLIVDANGAGEVWIDELNTGYLTPTMGIQVPIGKHVVELRDGNGGRGTPITVEVSRGQTVRAYLTPPSAPKPPEKP